MKNKFWQNKKVLVTGGNGFIGSFVVEKLISYGAKVEISCFPRPKKYINKKNIKITYANLLKPKEAIRITKNKDIIFHLAAIVGNINYNKKHPASMFIKNLEMAINILEGARINKCKRILLMSSAVVYSPKLKMPLTEEKGLDNFPHPANAGYAWAKRMIEFIGKSYYEEYGLEVAIARPDNIYGPRDHFDLKFGHVVPNLITKIDNCFEVKIWGSGDQKRTFTYVSDLSEGLILLTEKYAKADPVNLSGNETVKIKSLAKMLAKIMNKKVKFRYDTKKPEGHKLRICDTKKAKKILNFSPETDLENGLKKTVEWYYKNKNRRSN